ncbi:MAG: hypothetical protein WAM81_06670 [Acidimicrobiia bacterium]
MPASVRQLLPARPARCEATARLDRAEEVGQSVLVTPKLVSDTIDEMSGLLERAALDTRVAWVRDLFESDRGGQPRRARNDRLESTNPMMVSAAWLQ